MRKSPRLEVVKKALAAPKLVKPEDIPLLLKDALDAIEILEQDVESAELDRDWYDLRLGDCDCA